MINITVVGAGPAGAATALLLAQQGHQVALVERETAFERVFRGEGLMPAGLDALYQMGLKETFESIPSRRLTSWDFYVGGQRRMRVIEPEKDGLATQIIDQGALLKAIAQKAAQLPNFQLHTGWQATELLRNKDNRVVGLRASKNKRNSKSSSKNNSESKDFSADCVIACDGRYSRLRKLAGLNLKSADAQFDVLWFKLPAPHALSNEPLIKETPFFACLQPDRQFAFYPSWDGRLQIGWVVEKKNHRQGKLAALKERDWIEAFACALPTELARHFRAHKDELEGPIYLDVQVGCCERWSIPGLLVIGDAAHPMAPNRAQGINMAFRDAIVVANHFAALDDGPVTDEVLEKIQAARSPEIVAVQKMQLAEWRKVEFISRPGVPYLGFKAIATLFGRFRFAQNIWLHEQKGLREGVSCVQLKHDFKRDSLS